MLQIRTYLMRNETAANASKARTTAAITMAAIRPPVSPARPVFTVQLTASDTELAAETLVTEMRYN